MPIVKEIRIPEVTPATTPLSDLIGILTALNKALTEGSTPDLPEPSRSVVALISIREGSNNLAFQLEDPYDAEYDKLTEIIASRNYSKVPISQHEALADLGRLLNKNNWSLIFPPVGPNNIEPVISKLFPVPPIEERSGPRGFAELFGKCIRVGGEEPTVRLRLTKGSMITAKTNKEVAKDVAKHLYEDVVVAGEAMWDSETWVILSFRILSLRSYDLPTPANAFQRLSEIIGDSWEGINAEKFVTELRYEDSN